MAEKSVQTYIRAPNGDLYGIDEEGQAFRSVSGPGEQTLESGAQSTHDCHVMPDHVGAHITPGADLPCPEGANILPGGMGAHIVPDGLGQTIKP